MSTARTLWLLWCLGWAAVWFVVGIGTLGLGFIGSALSVAAFWLPVGKTPPQQLPPPPPPPPSLPPGGYFGGSL